MMEYTPLPSSFMLISIVGFFISLLVVYNRFPSWGFAFMLVFLLMFINSVISMTKSEVGHKEMLYLHGMKHKSLKKHAGRLKGKNHY